MCHGRKHKERNEQTDAAISDESSREHDREHNAAFSQTLCHKVGYGRHRAAVFHELAEDRPEQEERKKLGQEAGGAAHENLRPVGEQRLAAEKRGDQRRGRREQQYAPAAKG